MIWRLQWAAITGIILTGIIKRNSVLLLIHESISMLNAEVKSTENNLCQRLKDMCYINSFILFIFDNSDLSQGFYNYWSGTGILICQKKSILKLSQCVMNNLDYYFPGLHHTKYTANYFRFFNEYIRHGIKDVG